MTPVTSKCFENDQNSRFLINVNSIDVHLKVDFKVVKNFFKLEI